MILLLNFFISFLVKSSVSVSNKSVVFLRDKLQYKLRNNSSSVDSMLSSQKSLLLCNPDTVSLFSKFFMQRWMDAKSEIGYLTV